MPDDRRPFDADAAGETTGVKNVAPSAAQPPQGSDWGAKTHFVDISGHASLLRELAYPAEGCTVVDAARPRPSPEPAAPSPSSTAGGDGFSTVVTVVGQLPAAYGADFPKGTGVADETASSGEWALPLRKLGARFRDDFRRAPPIIRLLFVGLPAIAWTVIALGQPPASPRDEPTPVVAHRPTPPRAANAVPSSPTAFPSQSPALPSPAPPSKEPAPLARARSSPAPANRTLEARAVDAAARGAHAEAIAMYEELAALRPDRTEFASAARILKGRQAREEP